MINYEHYTYRVTWSEEDKEFVGLCSEFPSLSYLGASRSEALEGISKLVEEVVKDMLENEEEIPVPFSERHYSGKFQVRIPPEQHRLLTMKAQEAGVSLNRYISSKLLG